MLKKIEALRKAPKHVRTAYAFWIALIVTFVLLVLWGSTLPARFSQEKQAETPLVTDDLQTFSSTVRSVFYGALEQFGTKKDVDPSNTETNRVDFVELLASSTEQIEFENATSTHASSTSGVVADFASTTPQNTHATSGSSTSQRN
jgi:hypothetical protein